MNRDQLAALAANVNVAAMLRVIRQGESLQDDNAYRVEYGGTLFNAPPWAHPYEGQSAPPGKAAGAYQYIPHTWQYLATKYGFEDFSPTNQDLGAIALIAEHGALDDVLAGRVDAAVRRLTKVWTSLAIPSRQADAPGIFAAYGGTSVPTADAPAAPPDPTPVAPTPEVKMPPTLIFSLLETLVPMIPQLGKLFGSGSEVSNRNIAAAQVIADNVVKVTDSVNLQDAVEKINSDPQALQAATQAVATAFGLGDVGGGIPAARDASHNSEGDWKKVFISVPMVVIVMLMPLVYFVVWNVVKYDTWSAEIKASVVSAVISGVLFAIVGFALGQSYQKKELK